MKISARIRERFQNFKYRHAYVDEFTDAYIATQIKVLREQNGMNQTELAEKAGMHQSQVSALEDVNNRSWKVTTLKKLARAFDLVLVVRFEAFSAALPEIDNLKRKALERTAFKDDQAFSTSVAAASASTDDLSVAASLEMPTGKLIHGNFGSANATFSLSESRSNVA